MRNMPLIALDLRLFMAAILSQQRKPTCATCRLNRLSIVSLYTQWIAVIQTSQKNNFFDFPSKIACQAPIPPIILRINELRLAFKLPSNRYNGYRDREKQEKPWQRRGFPDFTGDYRPNLFLCNILPVNLVFRIF
jgi:hypothetical protein